MIWRAAAAASLSLLTACNTPGSLRFCAPAPELSVGQQDRLLQVTARVQADLDAEPVQLALVARAGLRLEDWFGARFSHGGLSLRANRQGPWAVRQLYYACEEGRAQLFDQGLGGFLMGSEQPDQGYLSVLLLPPEAEAPLRRAAEDVERIKQLLGGRYVANAPTQDPGLQNCNQWLVELLALAWRDRPWPEQEARVQAQQALQEQGYAPEPLQVGAWTALIPFVPYLSLDGHDADARASGQLRVSLPQGIEDWVHRRWPATRRIEYCFTRERLVRREGWEAQPRTCEARPGERSWPLS